MRIFFKILFSIIVAVQVFLDLSGLFSGELIIPITWLLCVPAIIGLWQKRFYGVFFMEGYIIFILFSYTYILITDLTVSNLLQWIVLIIVLIPTYFVLKNEFNPQKYGIIDRFLLRVVFKKI